jgi:hypothetical protein
MLTDKWTRAEVLKVVRNCLRVERGAPWVGADSKLLKDGRLQGIKFVLEVLKTEMYYDK